MKGNRMSNTHISFAQRLKEENRTTHDSVDYLVMSVAPFADIARYTLFLKLQSVFHKPGAHLEKSHFQSINISSQVFVV